MACLQLGTLTSPATAKGLHIRGNLKTSVSFIKKRQEDRQEVFGARLHVGVPQTDHVPDLMGEGHLSYPGSENIPMNQCFLR